MTKLYELTDEYAALLQAAEEGEDVDAALALIGGAIEAKAEGIVRVIASLESTAEACGKESRKLASRGSAAAKQVERLREYVRSCMQSAGVTKVKGPTFSVSLSPGQGKVEITDLAALKAAAPELVRVETVDTPDKRAILARYKADGECLPGTRVIPTTTLTVR